MADQMDDLISEMTGIANEIGTRGGRMIGEPIDADHKALAVGMMVIQSLDFLVEAIREVNHTLNMVRERL